MNATSTLVRPIAGGLRALMQAAMVCAGLALAACGGSADAPPPPETVPVLTVAPTITLQPASQTVTVGQPATFAVAATGTAPLAYQWQRNGVAIAGATSTTFSLPATVLGDSGATFRAVVSNVAGSATSNNATLTVSPAAPVLTIAPQPASVSVTAGASASFTVGGTCSAGTLSTRWQRSPGAPAASAFVDIAGATSATFTLATAIGDNGALFRAVLDCSGQSSTPSAVATLTVTAPGSVSLALLAVTGLRDQADISSATAIDQDAGGSFTFVTASRIKRLSADLTTIDFVAGGPFAGSADGAANVASFNQPQGLTQDGAGVIYVADTGNHTIRRIAVDGTVTTVAGSPGVSGNSDGSGAAARFNQPAGIAFGPDGDLYVAELSNHLVRRVTVAGVVTTYAGTTNGFLEGAANVAKFSSPLGIAVASNGDVLVADRSNNRVRRILRAGNAAGAVQTLAGNGTFGAADVDGVGTAAAIGAPSGIVLRGNTLTVRDSVGLLRQIDLTTANVTTIAGSRVLGEGFADGTATTARIRDIGIGLTAAAAGGFMLADDLALRAVSATGAVRTIASHAAAGITPTGVGTLLQQPFSLAINRFGALAVDGLGHLVVADNGTEQARRIDAAGAVTLAAGLTGGFEGVVDGIGSAAQFVDLGIALASSTAGVLFVADDYVVRRIGTDNAVTTLAGSTTTFGGVDGNAATARFNRIFGMAVGPSGDVFAGDAGNNAVRRVDATGNVTTYAGVIGQSAHVDGPIATARFIGPRSIAFGPDGSLYVADYQFGGGFLRKISADGSTVSTINAALGQVFTLTVDAAGTVYYSDPAGLWSLLSGAATATLLIPATAGNNVLGTSPRLFTPQSMAMLGPKQIVMISASQLLVATLP